MVALLDAIFGRVRDFREIQDFHPGGSWDPWGIPEESWNSPIWGMPHIDPWPWSRRLGRGPGDTPGARNRLPVQISHGPGNREMAEIAKISGCVQNSKFWEFCFFDKVTNFFYLILNSFYRFFFTFL